MKPAVLIAIIVVFLIPVVAVIATHTSSTNSPAVTPTPSASASASPAYTIPDDAVTATQVMLQTDKGNITLNLYPDIAPLAVRNFVTLGKRGYYNGTYFHRIMESFMIQGGDPTGTGSGGQSIYGTGFATETGNKKFVQGTLGMARTSDPNSNGSQFFIVTKSAQPSLDGQYTVFGQVADPASQTVVDAIAGTPTTLQNPSDPTSEQSVPSVKIHITGFQIIQ